MPAFLEDFSAFYGTGERNPMGQSLAEFLQEYDPRHYEGLFCTADIALFSCEKGARPDLSGLKVLLVKRGDHPCIGFWALPGGFVNLKENLEEAARREFFEETGLKAPALEQLASYGDYDRDPRARIITTVYMALVEKEKLWVQAGDDAKEAAWCDLSLSKIETKNWEDATFEKFSLQLKNKEKGLNTAVEVVHRFTQGLIRGEKFFVQEKGQIAFDHGAILVQALLRLQSRLQQTKGPFS